jgi:heme exporter protein D
MIEFLSMGKHTAFVYIAYIFSIIVLLLGYYFPHYALKKEIRIKNDKNNKNK